MKKLLILAFVLIGTVSFGANPVEDCASKSGGTIHFEFTYEYDNGCVIQISGTATFDEAGNITSIHGSATFHPACPGDLLYASFSADGEVDESGHIIKLDTFSENDILSSDDFGEALRGELNDLI